MAYYSDIKGTIETKFRLGAKGPYVGAFDTTTVSILTSAGNSYADVVIADLIMHGNIVNFNTFATNVGADRSMTLSRPLLGMTNSVNYVLPPTPVDGQAIISDANGNLSFAPLSGGGGGGAGSVQRDSTAITIASGATTGMFELPPNAVVDKVTIILDTPFDDPAVNVKIGIAADLAKYMKTTDSNLSSNLQVRFESFPNQKPVGAPESIIATFNTGASTVGEARILVDYCVPT